ncbi:MAG: nitrogenase component 1 [Methanomicrobiales archaeon]|nr:nitrogenase component 1 [Methanomicrobiales archaeon]
MENPSVEIPRATCRLFGTIRAIGTIRNSAILVHGPRGCVYHINYILGMRGDRPSRITTTALDEHDVVFGAEGKLVEAIETLDRTLSPDVIFVLSCCASGIIGEDVEGASREARTRARVVSLSGGGFEGDHRTGTREALARLAEVLVRPDMEVTPGSVNLIGLLRSGPDLVELKRLLASAGVQVTGVLTAGATLPELEGLGRAALNVVLCETTGRDAAEMLRERCGTPWIAVEFPIGREGAERFLVQVTGALGIGRGPAPAEVPERETPREGMARRVAIVGGPTRAVAVARFLREAGNPPVLVAVEGDPESLRKVEEAAGPGCVVLADPLQEEMTARLTELGVDLLIGGMRERPVAALLGIDHVDVMHGSQKTVGEQGGELLRRALERRGKTPPAAPE